MPALTVKAVTKALSDYVRPDEDIVAKLNMVMPRLYAMGMWRDLLYDWSIETKNDYFALPEHADSLLGAMLQNSPVDAQSQWHDYRISGYASDGPAPIFGIVDDGFHPTKEEIPYPSSKIYYLKAVPLPSVDSETNAVIQLPTDGEVAIDMVVGQNHITKNIALSGGSSTNISGSLSQINTVTHALGGGEDTNSGCASGTHVISSEDTGVVLSDATASGASFSITIDVGSGGITVLSLTVVNNGLGFEVGDTITIPETLLGSTQTDADETIIITVSSVTSVSTVEAKNISYYGVPEKIRIIAENDADATEKIILAEIKGDGVARYRRFRFSNSSGTTQNVKLLLKRAWEPVLTQDDILYLGNLNVIKHGLLGMLAEDNADLERAQYHWTICRQLLDEELDATRGAAKPKVTLKPAGNNFNTPNII